jgi:hypothetical protein
VQIGFGVKALDPANIVVKVFSWLVNDAEMNDQFKILRVALLAAMVAFNGGLFHFSTTS